jgi:hypothetical protein
MLASQLDGMVDHIFEKMRRAVMKRSEALAKVLVKNNRMFNCPRSVRFTTRGSIIRIDRIDV